MIGIIASASSGATLALRSPTKRLNNIVVFPVPGRRTRFGAIIRARNGDFLSRDVQISVEFVMNCSPACVGIEPSCEWTSRSEKNHGFQRQSQLAGRAE